MDSQYSKIKQGAAIGVVDHFCLFLIEVDNEMILAGGRECSVERVCCALQIITGTFGDHGLQLHDERGKTMVMLQFTVQTKAANRFVMEL